MVPANDDKVAIRELTARYNFALDEGRCEDLAATFVTDGVFESRAAKIELRGREEIANFARGWATKFTARHLTTDAVVEIEGDRAHQRCYLLLFFYGDNAPQHYTAVYEDDLVRTVDGWRFSRRHIERDGMPS